MDKLERYKIQVKDIKEENDINMYKLRTDEMTRTIDEIIQDTVMKFHVMIPRLLSEKSEELQKVLKDAKEQLSRFCKTVGDFCHFYQYYKKLLKIWEDLFFQNTNIQQLKDMAKKHNIKINDADWEMANM